MEIESVSWVLIVRRLIVVSVSISSTRANLPGYMPPRPKTGSNRGLLSSYSTSEQVNESLSPLSSELDCGGGGGDGIIPLPGVPATRSECEKSVRLIPSPWSFSSLDVDTASTVLTGDSLWRALRRFTSSTVRPCMGVAPRGIPRAEMGCLSLLPGRGGGGAVVLRLLSERLLWYSPLIPLRGVERRLGLGPRFPPGGRMPGLAPRGRGLVPRASCWVGVRRCWL